MRVGHESHGLKATGVEEYNSEYNSLSIIESYEVMKRKSRALLRVADCLNTKMRWSTGLRYHMSFTTSSWWDAAAIGVSYGCWWWDVVGAGVLNI